MKNGVAFGIGIVSGVALVLVVDKITDKNDNKNMNSGYKNLQGEDFPGPNELPDTLCKGNPTDYTIPAGVTSIDLGAISRCGSLTTITVDKNNNVYSSIDGVLFNKNQTELIIYPSAKIGESYEIPDSVTSIVSNAFGNCKSLTTITIPASVTSIGDYAFFDCESLTSINIPSSVTSIGSAAFYNCKSLTTITIPANSQLTSIGDSAFSQCSSLTTVNTIPVGLKSIGSDAFSGCSSLVPFDISNVEYVGDNVFKGCKSPSKGGKGGKGGKNRC